MVRFGSTIFSTNEESMMLCRCIIKSLLLLIALEEKCLLKVFQSYPEPWGNFEQIQIYFFNLLHLSRRFMPSFYTLLRQSGQTSKDLSKFKTILKVVFATFLRVCLSQKLGNMFFYFISKALFVLKKIKV